MVVLRIKYLWYSHASSLENKAH